MMEGISMLMPAYNCKTVSPKIGELVGMRFDNWQFELIKMLESKRPVREFERSFFPHNRT
jgi:hypothetical protein